jgi:hypothetical protein
MSIKDVVIQELDRLDDAKLQQVADYLAFLRFQSRPKPLVVVRWNDWFFVDRRVRSVVQGRGACSPFVVRCPASCFNQKKIVFYLPNYLR